MGPRFRKRGNECSGVGGIVVIVLQWGRAFGSAETWSRCWSNRRRSSFNGAALSEARKRGSFSGAKDRRHCFNGAALSEARKLVADVVSAIGILASMGPRFRKRGNAGEMVLCVRADFASMGPRFRKRGNEPELLKEHFRLVPASMGPRFRKRGNRVVIA